MNNFTYYTPTKVVFGRGSEGQTGALVRERGCKKVLLHYGGGSAVRSGLLDRVKDSLREAGLEWTELGGALPNPRLSLVREGVDLCRREGVDFLLAVGGGSVIDSAKAMAYGAAEEGDVWDLYCGKRQARAALPVGAVLTIAAAGSEMSDSSVITNEDGWIKRGYSSDLCRPVFAVMNPELTMTLPAYQTACGCTDILMHTMERYFHPEAGMALTDSLAEALMRTVMESARVLTKEPENYEARAEVMWAGSLSHNGLTGCGAGGDWMTHKLEHELGGLYDVAHGAGLAAVRGSWARYVYRSCPERFARFAVHVLGLPAGADAEETALRGIGAMEDFYRELGMPTSLRELGVAPTEAELALLARKCAAACRGGGGAVRRLEEADLAAIYRMAL